MNAPAQITPADHLSQVDLAALEAMFIRSPAERYATTVKAGDKDMRRQLLKLERAHDRAKISQELHAALVPACPTHPDDYRVFDFQAAERGRVMSKAIGDYCFDLRNRMAAEDEAYLAAREDHERPQRIDAQIGRMVRRERRVA